MPANYLRRAAAHGRRYKRRQFSLSLQDRNALAQRPRCFPGCFRAPNESQALVAELFRPQLDLRTFEELVEVRKRCRTLHFNRGLELCPMNRLGKLQK